MPALSSRPAPSLAPASSAASPANARRLAENMIEVMSALLAIVEQETKLVRAGKVREAMDLEPQKSATSHKYIQTLTELGNSRDYLARSTPELLTALHRHHDTFRAMLQVNLTVLATAHAVSEGIVRGVSNEVQRRNLPQGYTAGGQRTAPAPRHAAPLSVSRVL